MRRQVVLEDMVKDMVDVSGSMGITLRDCTQAALENGYKNRNQKRSLSQIISSILKRFVRDGVIVCKESRQGRRYYTVPLVIYDIFNKAC